MEFTKTKILILIVILIIILIFSLSLGGGKTLLRNLGLMKPESVDCVYSEWGAWEGDVDLACSTIPGTDPVRKTRNRSRKILAEAKGDGKVCDLTSLIDVQSRDCAGVPRDCITGTSYSEWGPTCSPQDRLVVGGKIISQTNNRSGDIGPLYGGITCPPITGTRSFNCPTDCQVSDWSSWGPDCPSGPTGGNNNYNQNRSRNIVVPPRGQGAITCPPLNETRITNCPSIPQNCEYTWSSPSPSCPSNLSSDINIYQLKEPIISKNSNWGGTPCPDAELITTNCPATTSLTNIPTSFVFPINYNNTDMKNYGGIRRLENAKNFCPTGNSFSSGIRGQTLTYTDPDTSENLGVDNQSYLGKAINLKSVCSTPFMNNGSSFTRTTSYTSDMGQLFGGSIGNMDCGDNAILTDYKVVPEPGPNPDKKYGFEYKCQPVINSGRTQTNDYYYINRNMIYNERKNGLVCGSNQAISKIEMENNNTFLKRYNNTSIEVSNLESYLVYTESNNIDHAEYYLQNTRNNIPQSNLATYTPSSNGIGTINYYNIPSNIQVSLVSNNNTNGTISLLKSSVSVIENSITPLITPYTKMKYSCLNK